jgi:hypothetical protein
MRNLVQVKLLNKQVNDTNTFTRPNNIKMIYQRVSGCDFNPQLIVH